MYPVVSINDKQLHFKTGRLLTVLHTALNSTIVYQLFAYPIFVPAITTVICNPFFFLPSFVLNYGMLMTFTVYFYSRSFVTNMFLKPNGKQIIVETLDGESKVINNSDIFSCELVSNKWQSRIEFNHGANNYLYIRGNSFVYDGHILESILENNFIDVKNVAYDYDLTKEFTWDFKELVELKKKKRIVNKFYKPNIRTLEKLKSVKSFTRNQREGSIQSSRQVLSPFELYNFQVDQYDTEIR